MIFWIIQNIFQTISNQKTEEYNFIFKAKNAKLKILLLSILERGIVILKDTKAQVVLELTLITFSHWMRQRALIEFADSFHK